MLKMWRCDVCIRRPWRTTVGQFCCSGGEAAATPPPESGAGILPSTAQPSRAAHMSRAFVRCIMAHDPESRSPEATGWPSFLNVFNLESGRVLDVIIRRRTRPFWKTCIEAAPNATCRVAAVGTSGIITSSARSCPAAAPPLLPIPELGVRHRGTASSMQPPLLDIQRVVQMPRTLLLLLLVLNSFLWIDRMATLCALQV
jgi:hypothetical protein